MADFLSNTVLGSSSSSESALAAQLGTASLLLNRGGKSGLPLARPAVTSSTELSEVAAFDAVAGSSYEVRLDSSWSMVASSLSANMKR